MTCIRGKKTFGKQAAVFKEKNLSIITPKFPTGIKSLDAALGGGFIPGLTIIGALSGLGKTTLLTQIASNYAMSGIEVLYVTLEMTLNQLVAKTISCQSYIYGGKKVAFSSMDLRDIDFLETMKKDVARNQYHYDCCKYIEEKLQNLTCVEPEDGLWTVTEIRKCVQEGWIDQGLPAPIIMIDYLQLMPFENSHESDEVKILGTITENLKKMGNDFGTPVVAISSINRASYNEAIGMQAFKGSGNIEFNSDTLIGIQLRGVGTSGFNTETAKNKEIRNVELKIIKSREGHAGAIVPLDYCAEFNYFSEAVVNDRKQTQENTKQKKAEKTKVNKKTKDNTTSKKQGNPPAEDKTSEPEAVELSQKPATDPRFTEAEIMDFFY